MFSVYIDKISGFIWNNLLLFFLVGTGILFSVRTGFVQIRKFGSAFSDLFRGFSLNGKKADRHGISSFQALATSVAAQVGTGNIIGCATALYGGGPGAIFWMWLSAFFGMATIYGEAVLSQIYKTYDSSGHITGGPIYYIRGVFKKNGGKFLSVFFAVAIIFALGFAGNMVQANSITDSFFTAFGVPKLITGIIIAILAGIIFFGGVKTLASVTEKIVPLMAVIYVAGCLVILVLRIETIPDAFRAIFVGAFNPSAVLGGAAGIGIREAMRFGVARGLFSNEAGMGSTPHAHALAKVGNPGDQGKVAMMGVFFDTFVVLTLTALVIITSGKLMPGTEGALEGAALAQAAFSETFGSFGSVFIAVCMLFFAFSTILGWYFFGEVNFKALFGNRFVKIYSLLVIICIVVGSVLKITLVWSLSDLFNGLMVFPNLIALLALSGVVSRHR